MKKKIIFSVLLSICISIGAILLINKNHSKQETLSRDFIVVTATGKSNYDFPITLDKGVTASQAVLYFTDSYSHIQRKQGTRLIELQPDQRISSDIQIKIS